MVPEGLRSSVLGNCAQTQWILTEVCGGRPLTVATLTNSLRTSRVRSNNSSSSPSHQHQQLHRGSTKSFHVDRALLASWVIYKRPLNGSFAAVPPGCNSIDRHTLLHDSVDFGRDLKLGISSGAFDCACMFCAHSLNSCIYCFTFVQHHRFDFREHVKIFHCTSDLGGNAVYTCAML